MATFQLDLSLPAKHVAIAPGGEIRLEGSFVSPDGAIIDAATTSWPDAEQPGVDAGGMVDFAGGGFHVTSRDPARHEVVAVATGEAAPMCQAAGVASPCIALRTAQLARTRLLTRDELRASLHGQITVEMVAPPPPPEPPEATPLRDAAQSPYALAALLAVVAVAALAGLWGVHRRAQASPRGQMRALVIRVEKKLRHADAALAVTLTPVVKKTLSVIDGKKVGLMTPEGVRIREALLRVEARLDQTVERVQKERSREATDELLLEMESALEAAAETASIAR